MSPARIIGAVAFAACALGACGPAHPAPEHARATSGSSGGEDRGPFEQHGQASWYSDSLAGSHTASGIPYDPHRMTAAHRTLPLGTRVRVTREDDGRSVEVQINDRGPFGNERRIIDLSRAAAEQLGMIRAGVANVRVDVLEWGRGRRSFAH